MELKYEYDPDWKKHDRNSNRTFMELKYKNDNKELIKELF